MEIEVMNHAKDTFEIANKLFKYIGDKELVVWCGNLSNEISRKILRLKSDYNDIYRLCVALHNTVKFYDCITSKSVLFDDVRLQARHCAISIFFICVQSGILRLDDKFVSMRAFNEEVDSKDFSQCTLDILNHFDYVRLCEYVGYQVGNKELDMDTFVFGINTALILRVD